MTSPHFFVLLFHDPAGGQHVNLKRSGRSAFDLFVLGAAGTVRSCREQGVDCSIVTNDEAFLRKRFEHFGLGDVPVLAHAFGVDVPQGIRFRQAHYKLELIDILATGEFGEYVGLLDSDTVTHRSLPLSDDMHDKILVYDITAERGRVAADKDVAAICKRPMKDVTWYGGEFLLAPAYRLRALSEEMSALWPRYRDCLKAGVIDHVGSEAIFSAALNNLRAQDENVVMSVNNHQIITRWWSARTLFRQPPFHEVEDNAILHLPADKPFLSRFVLSGRAFREFVPAYRRHLVAKLGMRHAYTIFEKVLKRQQKIVARL